ncbi:hypothetical protein WH96_20170 [Kiloniella spongiae]|uniref:Glycosyl transferase family 1 domain-containing protein n=1 Tax=Kiloniella spongiae TaxID=1489064 RepID=A0A0H2MQL9_9PROT|nr:glycosyltransferase [Kiloniella spongiae]KLN58965.1 hypothetical protein WH96_20170 [Kiloniella spongiae]
MNNIKKLCFVIGSLDRGGAETHLVSVLPLLDRSQFQTFVYCFSRKGELSTILEEQGVEVYAPPCNMLLKKLPFLLKPILLFISVVSFYQFLLRRNPDSVHFFLPASYLLMGPVSLLHRRSKKLMSRRSLNLYQKKYWPIVRSLEFWLHKRVDKILGNSQKIIDELKVDEKVDEAKLALIYNGVQVVEKTRSIRQDIRKSMGIDSSDLILTIVANLIPYKGHHDLLEACTMLSRNDWKLIIVGHDSSGIRSDLENFVFENKLCDQVCFVGARDDVSDLWNASDIGLLVSHEEGFSNAVLEGMLARLPMIVTDVGGNAEAVIDGHTGLVVPPRSPEALANAIEALMENVELRSAMGTKAKERALDTFSLKSCVAEYEALYHELFQDCTR